MSEHRHCEVKPSQSRHPWRATLRTVLQVGIALASLLPTIAVAGDLTTTQGVAQVLAVCALVTRIMAVPGVNDFLAKFLPWLAAEPRMDEGMRRNYTAGQ